jgi:hypothetical protein
VQSDPSEWSTLVKEIISSTLKTQITFSDEVTWELITGVQPIAPNTAPMPFASLVLMVPSPILGNPPIMMTGMFPLSKVDEAPLSASIVQMLEKMAEQRSLQLNPSPTEGLHLPSMNGK